MLIPSFCVLSLMCAVPLNLVNSPAASSHCCLLETPCPAALQLLPPPLVSRHHWGPERTWLHHTCTAETDGEESVHLWKFKGGGGTKTFQLESAKDQGGKSFSLSGAVKCTLTGGAKSNQSLSSWPMVKPLLGYATFLIRWNKCSRNEQHEGAQVCGS